jgi:hypothetical protein
LVAAMIAAAFSLFSTSVTSSTNEQTLAASEQVLANYETYFDSVITVSNNVLGTYSNASDASETALAQNMASYFDTLETFKAEILNMSLYKAKDANYFSGDSKASHANANTTESWFASAKGNPLINFFSPVQAAGVTNTFTLSRYLTYDKDRNLDAVLKIDFDFAKIVDTVSQASLGEGGHFIIYTKDYQKIYTSSSDGEFTSAEQALVKDLVIGSTSVNFDSHYFYLYAATITNTSWRVAIFTNQDALRTAILRFTLIITLVGAAVIACPRGRSVRQEAGKCRGRRCC